MICRHTYVWPDGTCISCNRLATTLPGHVHPRHHIMVPRELVESLWALRKKTKAGLEFDMSDRIANLLRAWGYDVMARDREEMGALKGGK